MTIQKPSEAFHEATQRLCEEGFRKLDSVDFCKYAAAPGAEGYLIKDEVEDRKGACDHRYDDRRRSETEGWILYAVCS